ncbi:hypothetical protein GIV63_13770 [Pseudomonas sp. PA-3-10C]|nr:hypothetical protein [Pseudomonas sp. PA-3-6E]MCF5562649.1 hypothetical protein [Pseudomonas sp. PA-3-5D]MCF5594142.1 hypothetical protein [Pseudomonas sp. PA-3-10C]OKP64658.1 hypothetical protein BTR19_31160 [Pseudomonas fluorescens]
MANCFRSGFCRNPKRPPLIVEKRTDLLTGWNDCFWPKAVAISHDGRGLCAEAESTKAIKRQLAESLYVAYNDSASHRSNELKS